MTDLRKFAVRTVIDLAWTNVKNKRINYGVMINSMEEIAKVMFYLKHMLVSLSRIGVNLTLSAIDDC